MKKSMKNIIAVVLMVPIMAFGVSVLLPAVNTDAISCTSEQIAKGVPVECKGLAGGAQDSNTAGGKTELFGNNGVVTTVINVALYIIGSLSVIMLIIGGIRYTMSGGNDKSVAAAKSTILYAIIGVVIALLAYAIVNFVISTFTV